MNSVNSRGVVLGSV